MTELKIAFYDYNVFQGIKGSTFVGLQNFMEFFRGKDFPRVLKNTLMISFWQLLICFPLPIALAVCVTEMKNKFVSRMTQMSTLLTHFISVVVVCGIVINFLSPSTGVINLVLEKIGVDPVYFMTKPEYFKGIYSRHCAHDRDDADPEAGRYYQGGIRGNLTVIPAGNVFCG